MHNPLRLADCCAASPKPAPGFPELNNNVLSRAMNAQHNAPFKPLACCAGGVLKGRGDPLNQACTMRSPRTRCVNAARNGLYLRQFRHRSIVE